MTPEVTEITCGHRLGKETNQAGQIALGTPGRLPNQSPSAPELSFLHFGSLEVGGMFVVVLRKHPWIELLALLIGVAIFALAALQ